MRFALLASLGILGVVAALTSSTVHAQAVLTLVPSSGPCNGTVTATGIDFPANVGVQLALGQPDSDTEAAELAVVQTDANGTFKTTFTFPQLACDLGATQLTVFADQAGEPDDLEIYTRTDYQIVGEALPTTGHGPSAANSMPWLPIAAGLALALSSLLAGGAAAVRLRTG
jgi:hypothetical protein